MFGRELKNICVMNDIHDKYVNNIAEFDLLHAIINLSKCLEITSYHYPPPS